MTDVRKRHSFRADTDGQGRLSLRLVRWDGDGDTEFEVTEVGLYKRDARAALGAVNRALEANKGRGVGLMEGRWSGVAFGVTPECADALRQAMARPEQGVLI